jgi:multiple sugar transport system permease protein
LEEPVSTVPTTGPVTGISQPTRRRLSVSWHRQTPYLFLAPAMIVLVVIILYPMLFNAQLSVHNTRLVSVGLGDFVGLDNYRRILRDEDFWHSLRVSVTFTVLSVVFSFVIGFAIALVMNEVGRVRSLFLGLLLIPWVISPVITAYSWRWLFNDEFGLVNVVLKELGLIDRNITWLAKPGTAVFAVVVASVWRFVPYMMIMMLAGLQSIPRDLYEAAEVDGAGAWSKFIHITLSELRYIIGVVVMFALIWSFNDFTLPFIMTQGGPSDATNVLPIMVYRTAFDALRFGRGAALAMVILLILLVFSVTYALRLLREEKGTA